MVYDEFFSNRIKLKRTPDFFARYRRFCKFRLFFFLLLILPIAFCILLASSFSNFFLFRRINLIWLVGKVQREITHGISVLLVPMKDCHSFFFFPFSLFLFFERGLSPFKRYSPTIFRIFQQTIVILNRQETNFITFQSDRPSTMSDWPLIFEISEIF